MGNAHDKLNDAASAASAFATALAIDPTDASAAYNLANAYRTLGRTEEAVGMYRTALASSGNDPPAAKSSKHANLAHTLDAAGRYEEASTSFVTALTLAPKDAGTYTALGHSLKSGGHMDRAVDAYKQALTLEPQAAAAYAGLGSALKQIDPKGAAEAFAAAARGEGGGKEAEEADEVRKWLDAAPPRLPSARASPREWSRVAAEGVYPAAFEERAKRCARMSMAEAVAMGSEKLLALGPTLLTNATTHRSRLSPGNVSLIDSRLVTRKHLCLTKH